MNLDFYIFQLINPIKDLFSFFASLDIRIFNGVNGLAGKWIWLDTLGIFFAEYFEYILIFCLFLFLAKNFKKYWQMIEQAILAGIISRLVFTEIIRWLAPKPRPFVENQISQLINHASTPAFPSGHAAFYFAIAAVVFLYYKKVYPPSKFWWGAGFLFFLASFLICFGRVFCGIHWPLDILAGAIVGIFSGWLIVKIFKK